MLNLRISDTSDKKTSV